MQITYSVYGGDNESMEFKYWSKSLREAKFFAKKNKKYSVYKITERRGYEAEKEVVFSNFNS